MSVVHSALFSLVSTGIITYVIPCYTAGKNAEAVGEKCLMHGIYSVIPLLGIYCHAVIRGKIREEKSIEVTNICICTISWLLPCCCAVTLYCNAER